MADRAGLQAARGDGGQLLPGLRLAVLPPARGVQARLEGLVHPAGPAGRPARGPRLAGRGGALARAPGAGRRGLSSVVGGAGASPPLEGAGFPAFARSLRSPALYEATAGAEPLTPI